MKKIASFIGKFYPPHIGHLWVIDNLEDKFDELYIIISKNNKRNEKIYKETGFEILDASLIKKWFDSHYKGREKIKTFIFDEEEFKPYPEDRDKWAEKFKKEFPLVNVKIADESYRDYNEKYFPEYEFYPIERDIVAIHSTDLRKDIKNNFDYLIPEAKDYFKNKG